MILYIWLSNKDKKMLKYISLIISLFFVISCNKQKKSVDVSEINATTKICRLDLELPKCKSLEDVSSLLDANPDFVESFIYYGIFPDKRVMAENFLLLAQDQKLTELFDEVAKEYSDISDVDVQLESLYKHVKYYFPQFEEPTVYMIMGGFGGFDANYMDEETIIFGMENFLTNKAKYFPRRETTPFYMHKHFTREKIPSKLSNMLGQFEFSNFDKDDKTLINAMIYWGKIYYFSEHMLPNTADSVIIEYTADEMARVEGNKKETYGYFAKNDLLFNEEKAAITKFVAPRPTTNEIGDKAPGRIGRYLGWEIVRSYMRKNPEVTIEQLMKDSNHGEIFRKAQYKPK
jgi:hypothetical protein